MSTDSIKETFFAECVEQMAELYSGLAEMVVNGPEPEAINSVFRSVHSIKGGAGAFSFDGLAKFAHVFENALDVIRSDIAQSSSPRLELLQRSADLLDDIAASERDGTEAPDFSELAESLEREFGLSRENADETADVEFDAVPISIDDLSDKFGGSTNGFEIFFKPENELYLRGHEPQRILRKISKLGECTVVADISAVSPLDEYEPEEIPLSWNITLESDVNEDKILSVFEWVEGLCELSISKTGQSSDETGSIDIDDFLGADPELACALEDNAINSATESTAIEPTDFDVDGDTTETAVELPVGESSNEAEPKPSASEKSALPAKSVKTKKTIRVESDKVDRLMNLMGEMVISQSMLASQLQKQGLGSTSPAGLAFSDMQALTKEIQANVMGVRAQPIKPVFMRMSRIIREVCATTGKKANLILEGEQTEVDSTVIEGLMEPLTHLVRNCVDHGVEDSSTRLENGKLESGEIRLSASHSSGSIVIEIADDGAGINRDKVLELAISKGLTQASPDLADNEIDNLIFEPGFSTSESVSSVSGRGVGMDVVRQSVQSLGGRVAVASTPGSGSCFTLVLPLTLAILEGMLVNVAEQILVVPVSSIVETLCVQRSDVFPINGGNCVIKLRDQLIPIVDISHDLGFTDTQKYLDGGTVVVVESATNSTCAFFVESIIGQQQVVIKSIEKNYRRIPNISSATILGTGQIALILDIEQIASRKINDNVQTMVLDQTA